MGTVPPVASLMRFASRRDGVRSPFRIKEICDSEQLRSRASFACVVLAAIQSASEDCPSMMPSFTTGKARPSSVTLLVANGQSADDPRSSGHG